MRIRRRPGYDVVTRYMWHMLRTVPPQTSADEGDTKSCEEQCRTFAKYWHRSGLDQLKWSAEMRANVHGKVAGLAAAGLLLNNTRHCSPSTAIGVKVPVILSRRA